MAPASASSSSTVSSNSIATGEPSTLARRATSTKTATAALLSAPRIVVVRVLPATVDHDRLDLAVDLDGVEVRAQQHRALGAAADAREQVAVGVRLDVQPDALELAR